MIDTQLPKYLYRKDDGERFTLKNGEYEMDRSMMYTPYRYTYARLMDTGAFTEIHPIPTAQTESNHGS